LVNQYIDFNKPKKPKPRKPTDPQPVTFNASVVEKRNFTLAQDSFLAKVSADLTKTNLQVAKMDKKLAIVSVVCKEFHSDSHPKRDRILRGNEDRTDAKKCSDVGAQSG
jgi:hypothetical protein